MATTSSQYVCHVRTPFPDLLTLWRIRQREVGDKSLAEYFHWLGVYDVLLRKPHRLTPWIAGLSHEEQQKVIHDICANFDDPHKPGGWLETRLKELADEELWRSHARERELREKVIDLEAENRALKEENARLR